MAAKYYAFISYNHRDAKIAQWLHKNLENFRLPSEIHNEIEAGQKFIRPVFRDKDELNAGILGNELRDKLEASKYLVVVCSRNSAKSEWVSNEVKAFIEMGRLDHIIPLIIEDGPEVFPKSLKEYTAEHPDQELLGVSIPEVGKQKALIRVISKMLDVSFDNLWNRHKRLRRRKCLAAVLGGLFVLLSLVFVWYVCQPEDIEILIDEGGYVNTELPAIDDIVVSLDLGTEVKTDTLSSFGKAAMFKNIPARMMGKPVHVSAMADHCRTCDTTLILANSNKISLFRDISVYGHVCGRLYNFDKEIFLVGRHVVIAGIETVTDSSGSFSVEVPITLQRPEYMIESPDSKLIDTVIYMPCGNEAVIESK